MVETSKHGEAFDHYYSMGTDRSLVSLAGHCGVSEKTAKRWSKAFNWQQRIIQRDLEINKKVEDKTDKAIVNTKADYRAGIGKDLASLELFRQRAEKLITDATDLIEDGEIKIVSIEDLDRVTSTLKKFHDLKKDYIKLDLILVGEDVPDRTDLNIILKLPEDIDVDDII